MNMALIWFAPTLLINLTWKASKPNSCITFDHSNSLWRRGVVWLCETIGTWISSHLSRRSICLPEHTCISRSTSWPIKCYGLFRLVKVTLLASGCSICSFHITLNTCILNKHVNKFWYTYMYLVMTK